MLEDTLQVKDEAEYLLLKCLLVNARKLYKRGVDKNNPSEMGLAVGWIDLCLDDVNRSIAPGTLEPTGSETAKP